MKFYVKCAFGNTYFCQLILLLNLFLLLFIGLTSLFDTIHGSHCTFQLTFTFICNILSKKFSISVK